MLTKGPLLHSFHPASSLIPAEATPTEAADNPCGKRRRPPPQFSHHNGEWRRMVIRPGVSNVVPTDQHARWGVPGRNWRHRGGFLHYICRGFFSHVLPGRRRPEPIEHRSCYGERCGFRLICVSVPPHRPQLWWPVSPSLPQLFPHGFIHAVHAGRRLSSLSSLGLRRCFASCHRYNHRQLVHPSISL